MGGESGAGMGGSGELIYYIMSEEGSHILETQSNCPTAKELQETANFMSCAVYVIQGEHTGMSAAPDDNSEDEGTTATVEFDESDQRDFWQIKAGLGQ